MSELYLIIALFTYIFNMIDYAFTKYWVDNYGIESEGNRIGRWILGKKWRVIVFKFVIPFVCLSALWLLSYNIVAKIALIVLLVIFSLVNIYHLIIAIKISQIQGKKK